MFINILKESRKFIPHFILHRPVKMISDFILDTSRQAFIFRDVYQNISLNDTIINTWWIRQYEEGSYGLLICDISQLFAWRNFVKEWKCLQYSQRSFEPWAYWIHVSLTIWTNLLCSNNEEKRGIEYSCRYCLRNVIKCTTNFVVRLGTCFCYGPAWVQ